VGLTSPEEYDTELERMNSAMLAENQALQYDNKQLNALIKEYETTLETVMGLFRQRAVRFLTYSMESMRVLSLFVSLFLLARRPMSRISPHS
jgi:SIKE family